MKIIKTFVVVNDVGTEALFGEDEEGNIIPLRLLKQRGRR